MAGLADPPVGHTIGDPVQADPAASGTRRCTASSFVPPHVTANTRRPSPRLDRDVDDPSGDGSSGIMAWGLTGVDEMALIFVRLYGAHLLPLGGGECEFQHLGFSQVLEIPREGQCPNVEVCMTPSPTKSEV